MFRRLLSWAVPVVFFRPTAAPYAIRFRRFVAVGVPGGDLFALSHEQAKALAEQLSPTPQR